MCTGSSDVALLSRLAKTLCRKTQPLKPQRSLKGHRDGICLPPLSVLSLAFEAGRGKPVHLRCAIIGRMKALVLLLPLLIVQQSPQAPKNNPNGIWKAEISDSKYEIRLEGTALQVKIVPGSNPQ